MQTFKDAKGRTWTISLTIGRARAVLDKTGVDLLHPESSTPPLPEVLVDDMQVARILQVLLDSEFARLNLDPTAVMDEDWDGKTTQASYDALLAEIAGFFEARGQTSRAQIVRKTAEAIREALIVVGERVAAMDPAAEVRRLASETPSSTAGNTSGRPQAASALTPAD